MDGGVRGAALRTLAAFYDLAIGPVSFDFIPFLVRAKMAAEDAGCERLHVVIMPDPKGVGGMFRDKSNLYDAHEMHWRLWNLVIPACQLIGATVTLATGPEQASRLHGDAVFPADWNAQSLKNKQYLVRPIVEAARAGRVIPRLKASEHAKRSVRHWLSTSGRNLATITLRNTYEPGRNADRAAYHAIADALELDYHRVIRIEDTADELRNGQGYAGINLDLRMACYELAAVNVIGNNGPAQLLWFSDASFIEFEAAMPFKDWKKFWQEHIGMDVDAGEQLPWARPDQRFVYAAPSVGLLGLH